MPRVMRHRIGAAADENLPVDTRAAGHLLSPPHDLNHFLVAAREVSAERIVLQHLKRDRIEHDLRFSAVSRPRPR